MNNRGLLIVLSGPSGVGKGTLLNEVLQRNENIVVSVSATTREPRPGEVDGVNYHFITKDQFKSMVDSEDMLEYALYGDNFYGTPKSMVENHLNEGRDVVLEIEVQGAVQIKKKLPQAVMVFVMPPSYQVLKDRLTGRGTETTQQIEKRLSAAKEEISKAGIYDYVIVNDQLQPAIEQIETVLSAARCSGNRMEELIKHILWGI